MIGLTEQQIEKQIYEFLNGISGCLCYKTGTTGLSKGGRHVKSNPMERKGKADLVCCFRGVYVGIEVKKPGGKQSEDQKTFESDVIAAHGEYWLVESLDQVIARLGILRDTI